MRIAKSLEELKEKFRPVLILEEEDFWWIKRSDEENFIKVYKPRKFEKIKVILEEGNFPKRYIDVLEKLEETEAIKIAKNVPSNRGLFLYGPSGVGKTVACIWKIAKLLQFMKIHAPLYVSAFDFDFDEVLDRKREADCIMIDDLNSKVLSEVRLKFLIELIYHAHSWNKLLFITTNEGGKVKLDIPEAVKSRIWEVCEVKYVEGEDLRRKKILQSNFNNV